MSREIDKDRVPIAASSVPSKPPLPRTRKWIRFGLVLISVAIGFCTFVYVVHDPLHSAHGPNDATAARIYSVRHLIANRYAANGHLPSDVSVFLRNDHQQLDKDSVGRLFHVRVHEDGVTVEIGTWGNDAQPGGTGLNRDIIGIFRADIPAGKQIEQVGPWIRDPLDDVKPWKW